MPENQDLCMELGSIPDTLPNRVEQREDDREHGIRKLWLPSFKPNWLNENRVLGRDNIKNHWGWLTWKALRNTLSSACSGFVIDSVCS